MIEMFNIVLPGYMHFYRTKKEINKDMGKIKKVEKKTKYFNLKLCLVLMHEHLSIKQICSAETRAFVIRMARH